MSPDGTARMLVTGGAGFVGRSIAVNARAAGFDVHVTWRTTAPPGGLPAHRVALDDHEAVDRLVTHVRPDVIVAAHGGPHRPSSRGERVAVWRDAPVATDALLQACRAGTVHFVLLTSSHEYAPSTTPLHEHSEISPVSLRGIAARAAADTVRLWARETGGATTILRPFSVYGPGEPSDRVIPTLLRAAVAGTPFHATGTDSGRDYVYVDDVAQALIRAVERTIPGEFNLGTGVNTTVPELIDAVELATGKVVDVRAGTFQPRPWDREVWVADPTRAAVELGWKAETSLVDGLRRALP